MPRQYDDPNAPHSSSCTRCSYQDKRAQPGNLPESNVLSQIAARWLIKYIHFSIQMVQFQTMLFIVRTSTLSREVPALLLHWWCSYQVLPQRRYAPTKLRAVTYEGNNRQQLDLPAACHSMYAYRSMTTRLPVNAMCRGVLWPNVFVKVWPLFSLAILRHQKAEGECKSGGIKACIPISPVVCMALSQCLKDQYLSTAGRKATYRLLTQETFYINFKNSLRFSESADVRRVQTTGFAFCLLLWKLYWIRSCPLTLLPVTNFSQNFIETSWSFLRVYTFFFSLLMSVIHSGLPAIISSHPPNKNMVCHADLQAAYLPFLF